MSVPNLKVALFQYDIAWENPAKNIEKLDSWIHNAAGKADLIILPEMFLTGFSMNAALIAQEMSGAGVNWMKSTAQKNNVSILGSLAINENGNYFNRLVMSDNKGVISYYDKRHLFRMGKEHLTYSQGVDKTIFRVSSWNILPLVCYDLRFPVWSRNAELQYDVLIYVANWPEPRRDAFLALLKARAIENQCYVLAVNRVGVDGTGVSYVGDSIAFDPKGKCIVTSNKEEILLCELSSSELSSFREKFPVHLDADKFTIYS